MLMQDLKVLFGVMGITMILALMTYVVIPPAQAFGQAQEAVEGVPPGIAAPESIGILEVVTAVSNVQEAKKSGEGLFLAIAALLALAFKILLSTLRYLAKEATWLKTQKGKAWVRMLTLILGALAGFTAALALDMPWTEAFVIGFSGPLSVATHEYSKIHKMLTGKGEEDAREKDITDQTD